MSEQELTATDLCRDCLHAWAWHFHVRQPGTACLFWDCGCKHYARAPEPQTAPETGRPLTMSEAEAMVAAAWDSIERSGAEDREHIRQLVERIAMLEKALREIADADPDAPEVESWKWLARKFMALARAALSGERPAPKEAKP